MALNRQVQDYYRENPLMISSPFGGVDGIKGDLLLDTFEKLNISIKSRRVLDVGCGRGYAESVVRDAGGDYTGCDFVASRPGLKFALADGSQLPFPASAFDGVFCIDAFEHFPEGPAAAREFHRVLKDDGFVFLSVPNYSNVAGLVKAYCEKTGSYRPNTWAPFRQWQPQEFESALTEYRVRRMFTDAGFSRFRCIGYGPEVCLGLFPWIAHRHMPERVMFRLQKLFGLIGPSIAGVWPGASLHMFWKIEK